MVHDSIAASAIMIHPDVGISSTMPTSLNAEVVIVVDRSGSMAGSKIQAVRDGLRILIHFYCDFIRF